MFIRLGYLYCPHAPITLPKKTVKL